MARYLPFTCLVLTALVLGTHQAPYHPNYHPYVYPHHYPAAPYVHHQARFNFNTNDFNSILIRTTTSTTRTIITSTTTLTCTKSTTACDPAGASNSLRFPFLSGIQKRSIEERELTDFEPSQIASIEPTAMPEERSSRSSDAMFYSSYRVLEPSLSREIHPLDVASQARFFFGTTTTITISSTTLVTTTRTLTPGCSLAGFFSQCP